MYFHLQLFYLSAFTVWFYHACNVRGNDTFRARSRNDYRNGTCDCEYMGILMSITNILTVFYYSNDIEMLLPLPLKPAQIISAKFLTVLITQYVMSSFILLPIFITYGLKSGAFITYYIYMIFIYLLFPIVPLVLASLLMTVIMRYTNIAKNKDRGNIFIGIVSILFIVGINVFLQWKNKSSFSEDAIADYLANNQSSLLVQMTNYFPTTYFGAVALVENAN